MKYKKVATAVALALSASSYSFAGFDESIGIDEFRKAESVYRVRASDIIGRDVVNKQDDEIGEVDDIIISSDNEVSAVLSVGGFLGLGEKHVLVSYNELRMGRDDDEVYFDSTKEQLKALPSFVYNEGELPGIETLTYSAGDEDFVDIDWEQIDAKWEQFKDKAGQEWAELTGEDWDAINDNRQEMVVRLQKATDKTKHEIGEEVNSILGTIE